MEFRPGKKCSYEMVCKQCWKISIVIWTGVRLVKGKLALRLSSVDKSLCRQEYQEVWVTRCLLLYKHTQVLGKCKWSTRWDLTLLSHCVKYETLYDEHFIKYNILYKIKGFVSSPLSFSSLDQIIPCQNKEKKVGLLI